MAAQKPPEISPGVFWSRVGTAVPALPRQAGYMKKGKESMAVPPRDPRPFRAPGGFPAGAKWIQPALVQSFSVAGCICLGKERNDRPGTGPVRPPEQRDAAPILSPALCVVRPECSGHAGRSLGTVLAKRRKRLPKGSLFLGPSFDRPDRLCSPRQRWLPCAKGAVGERRLRDWRSVSAPVLSPALCVVRPGCSGRAGRNLGTVLAKRRKRLPRGSLFLGPSFDCPGRLCSPRQREFCQRRLAAASLVAGGPHRCAGGIVKPIASNRPFLRFAARIAGQLFPALARQRRSRKPSNASPPETGTGPASRWRSTWAMST